jgi:hypothetical protein
MKLRFANARKKLSVKEEAEELLLTSVVKEDLQVEIPKANSQPRPSRN